MKFTVRASEFTAGDFTDNGRIVHPACPFQELSKARAFADDWIEKLKDPGAVVEVAEKKGRVKYRVERDKNGQIQRTGLV